MSANSAAFDFLRDLPFEMIAAPPRRFMKASTSPLNAFFTARSTLMVAVAYVAPASAWSPLFLTPAALASWANSCFQASKPLASLPQLAAWAAPTQNVNANAAAPKNFTLAENAIPISLLPERSLTPPQSRLAAHDTVKNRFAAEGSHTGVKVKTPLGSMC